VYVAPKRQFFFSFFFVIQECVISAKRTLWKLKPAL